VNTDTRVCVTGASGFIASCIVEMLLARGYHVRGTVRNRSRARDVGHLEALPGAADRLQLVEADLCVPGAFDDAVAGCRSVLHTASPYVLNVNDAQRDLVDPAVRGTEHVLRSCARTDSLQRVVVTSSMAAITDEPESGRVLTEADWNEKSSLTRNPYYYSKTLAERAAWAFMHDDRPRFDLVVINPFLVIGPSLTPRINTSNQVLVDMLSGAYPGIINLAWGFVDVRDVALAHILAMETPQAAGRYLCASATLAMREVVELMRQSGYGRGRLPRLPLDNPPGNAIVWLASFVQPSGVGSYLRSHVGRVPHFDNSKIRRELGLEFRPVESSILDAVADLERWGHVRVPPA
jgi:dihydroflavonol-4-reductase